ncbi:MAG: hypothetical protein AAB650_02115, partial [Patescibacteria group bacterium]
NEYLRRLIFRYVKDMGRIPSEVLIGLGSHFTFNEIVTIRRIRPHPADLLRKDEFDGIIQEFLATSSLKTVGGSQYALAHLLPFRVMLDGYYLETTERQVRGKTIEMVIFATYARDEFWRALGKIQSMFGGLDMRFISNQAALAASLITVLGVRDALIVKIGSNITEVSLLGEGALLATGQFVKGGDAVTSAIAKELGISHADAERIKRQWEKTILPPKTSVSVREAMRHGAEEWLGELTAFLKHEERFLLPERIYILGGGARLKVLQHALEDHLWYGDLTFLEKLDIQLLEAEAIASRIFANTSSVLQGPEEVALAALASRVHHSALALFPYIVTPIASIQA